MKRMLMITAILAGGILMTTGCGAQKKQLEKVKTDNMVELNIPLSGPQYRTDETCYRAVQSGVSPNSAMAKKIALQNARQELAAAIKADLAMVVENYGKGQDVANAQEYEAQYQELAYSVVEQQLTGVALIEEKLFKQENNSYKYYVCIQLNKADLAKKLENKISAEDKLKLEFDLDRFKKVYNEQMMKFQDKK